MAELARAVTDELKSIQMVESAIIRLVALGLVIGWLHHPGAACSRQSPKGN